MSTAKKVPQICRDLKHARQDIGLSQERVAWETSISQSTICELERGDSDPKLSTLMVLARKYGMEIRLCVTKDS